MTGDGTADCAAPSRASDHFDLFDAFRLVAAVAVVYSHSFPLTGRAEPVVPLIQRTPGAIAVGTFFVMSGFLITASWSRHQDAAAYGLGRASRILPGLLLVVVFSVLVLGPLATRLSPSGYFARGETWEHLLHTSMLAPVRYELPGVFEANPYPGVVNGSLWSLPYEVLAYVVVLGLGVAGALRHRRAMLGVAASAVLLHVLVVDTEVVGTVGAVGLDLRTALDVGLFFVIGCVAFVHQPAWRRHVGAWIGAGAALVLGGGATSSRVTVTIGLAIAVLAAGTLGSRRARALRRLGDPSFGTYVWAFPIQQVLASWGLGNPLAMFALAAPLAVGAGYLSWHVVELPALRLAKNRPSARAPAIARGTA